MSILFTKLNTGNIAVSASGKVFRKLSPTGAAPEAGLYDADGNLLADWDTLLDTYGLDCSLTCTLSNYKTKTGSGYYLLTNYFAQMTGLKLVIGDVTTIGNYNFYNCDGLTSVVFSDSVTAIGSNAFGHCDTLESVTFGSQVQSIGNYAFYNCVVLPKVHIPANVTTIGNYAFGNCTALTEAIVGNGVITVGNNAFYGCTNLVDLTLGSAVTSIGDSAFGMNIRLPSLVIPASVLSIGYRAFYKSNALASVTFENTAGWWVSTSATAESGTDILLGSPEENAVSLHSTYTNYYWKRS